MHALRPRELVVACPQRQSVPRRHCPPQPTPRTRKALTELAQTDAPPTILHARPRERGVEVVAPVEEHRPGMQFIDDTEERSLGRGGVRPDRGGKSVGRVVHQRDGFFVRVDFLDADDGAEGFFLWVMGG